MRSGNSYLWWALAVLAGAGLLPAALYFFLLSPRVAKLTPPFRPVAHFYENPKISLNQIRLKVFYVVPRNKTVLPDWQTPIQSALKDAVRFHTLEFQGSSVLNYDIFPEPVVLTEDNLAYDTTSTNRGNPYALLRISDELGRRAFRADGDLYTPNFLAGEPNEYQVLGIVYEGVGDAGSAIYESDLSSASEIAKQLGVPESAVAVVHLEKVNGFFLLNRDFLTNEKYRSYGATLMYHEFAHTLGLPDGYDVLTNAVWTSDIMGGGRYDPIGTAYLDQKSLHGLGILP